MMEVTSSSDHKLADAGDKKPTFTTHLWSRRVTQPILISVSITSLFTGVIEISQVTKSTTPWMSLAFLFLFVSLEGVYTNLWLESPNRRSLDRLTYRAAEVLVIAIIVRLFTWTTSGTWPQLRFLPNYLLSPLALFDDSFFLIGLFLSLLVWHRSVHLGNIFGLLAIDRAEEAYYSDPPGKRQAGNQPIPINRSRMVMAFFQQWIGGAVILIICTAITTINFSEVAEPARFRAITRLELRPEVLAMLLVYFISGLMLLSHARLAAMNARWLMSGTVKNNHVDRSWHRNSLWLVIIITIVAAFFPLGSTLAVGHLLEVIIQGIVFLVNLLMALFLAIMSMLFPRRYTPAQTTTDPAAPDLPPAISQVQPNETIAMVVSSLFWAVAIFMTVAAIIFFMRDRGVSIQPRQLKQLWLTFVAWLRSLGQDLSSQVGYIRQVIKSRSQPRMKERRVKGTPWPFLRINSLSPREQVRYFYLSTVKRASRRGVKRRQSKTPLEYARELKKSWPEAEDDVDRLTNAFIKARYSRRAIPEEDLFSTKQIWKRIRSRLRRRKKSG